MYYTVIKHDGHLRTRGAGECFLHFPRVLKCPENLSQFNTRLRLLHLFYDIDLHEQNNKTSFFYVLYSDKTIRVRAGSYLYYNYN